MIETRAQHPRIFFDGHCGICHGSVRFVARHDNGRVFRFAPIGGESFQRLVPASDRADLPDSVLVLTTDGRLLNRTEGTIYVLNRLGRPWRWLASWLGLIPKALRDGAYDLIARNRKKLLSAPTTVCPIVPAEQRRLFEA